ncbi:unnamed protein product [Caenorhabditis brenneri]
MRMVFKSILLLLAVVQLSLTQSSHPFDESQCQVTKGCYVSNSSQSNKMGVSWNVMDEETLELELFVASDIVSKRWVAVGFSYDEFMGNESVIECSEIGDKPSMKFSFDKATGKGNERITGDFSSHFFESTAAVVNNVLYCKSKVKTTGSLIDPHVFKLDASKQYHLLLANGKTTSNGLGYHREQSTVSRKVRLAEISPGFDQSECGKSKGCTIPTVDSCYNMNGTIGASYRVVSPSQIEFEIFGPANITVNNNVYVALGFSSDEKMNDISVIECSQLPSENAPTMKFSYNPGFKNARIVGEPAIRSQYIDQSIGRTSDGSVYCKGVVNVSGNTNLPEIFKWNSSQGYHLMLAAGFSDADGLTVHWGSCVSMLTFLDQIDNIGFYDSLCGVKKGCFSPTDCEGGCSNMKGSWAVLSPNQIHVEVSGDVNSSSRYVAMGFSTNGRMGNTSVIECSSFNDSNFSMTFSYNYVTEHYQNIRPTTDVSSLFSNQRIQFVDGTLYCSADVRVEGVTNDPSVFKYEPTTNYSIILATGGTTTNGTDKRLGYHHEKRSVAPFQLLSDYTKPTEAPAPNGEGSFDSSTCGHSKACYQPTTNDVVSYRVINDSYIEFEFSSVQPSASGVYLALGFSANGQMSPANVIECSSLGTQPLSMKFSANSGTSNQRITNEEAIRSQYITNTLASFQDGKIYCKGNVKSDGNSNSQIFKYTPSQRYYLIVAKGAANAGGLGYHQTNRFVSSQRLLTDLNVGNESGSKVTLVILHAIFMTVAWMTMVPTAVIFARVLRSSWPTLKPGGLLIWFHVHRGANLIGIALMVAGFVLILIHKDWKFVSSGWGGKHAIVGIIALCLAWLQPFISTLRCSPDNPRRPIFNYVHRGIGVAAMVLATTAICIAGFHFTPSRNVAQLVLALIPIAVIFALSLFFIFFNNLIDVDTKSFIKRNGSSGRTEDIPMRPTSKTDSETTWTIRSPQSSNTDSAGSSSNREISADKKRIWVNRFREFVVYGAVITFVTIGTILSVFFALGLSS